MVSTQVNSGNVGEKNVLKKIEIEVRKETIWKP